MGSRAISKQLPLLNGLAILAVVCNHATGWGYTAMFWWTDRYQPVSVPNFDQLGTLPYYVLRMVQQLTIFSVPSFLFISGFFIAYMGRSNRVALRWKVVVARLKYILIPYLIWSIVIFVGNAIENITYSPGEYLWQLISGQATPAYWYVSLICQFYLLSPLLLPFAKAKGKLFLLIAAVLQMGAMGLSYIALCVPASSTLDVIALLIPSWSFIRWAFFFAFGVFWGLRIGELKQWIDRLPRALPLILIVLGLLSILEAEVLSRNFDKSWLTGPLKLTSSLYSIVFVLCFLRFVRIPTRLTFFLEGLGKRSYGIYLLHPKILELTARVVRQLLPWILGYQLLFQPLLVVAAIGSVLLMMWIVAKSPLSKYSRYLFG